MTETKAKEVAQLTVDADEACLISWFMEVGLSSLNSQPLKQIEGLIGLHKQAERIGQAKVNALVERVNALFTTAFSDVEVIGSTSTNTLETVLDKLFDGCPHCHCDSPTCCVCGKIKPNFQ